MRRPFGDGVEPAIETACLQQRILADQPIFSVTIV